ncbi:hypothetical protein [Phage NBSal002]|nr:hypothetical protein [Phage NBSal002]
MIVWVWGEVERVRENKGRNWSGQHGWRETPGLLRFWG